MKRSFAWVMGLGATGLLACGGDDTSGKKTPPPDETPSCWAQPEGDDSPSVVAQSPLTQYVNPFIGTGGVGFGVGSAFPGPQRPFGMVRPGPDTMGPMGASDFSHCSGYSYGDEYVYGFSQTRMHGTGVVDYGTIGLFPTVGMTADKTSGAGRKIRFSHDDEHASPGSYDVVLADGTKVELTATDHVGLHRYTFEPSADATVLIDVGHSLPSVEITDGHVEIDPVSGLVTGFAHFAGRYSDGFGGMPVYFAARFDHTPTAHGVWKAGVLAPAEDARDGGDTGAYFTFDTTQDPEVTAAIAISFVDVDHAKQNLEAEVPTFDFEGVRTAAEAAWEDLLSRVHIEARNERDLTIAYSALYHTLLMPTLATESDGTYQGLDGQTHTADGFRYYTDFSLWDTYRTLHPWLSLVYPEYQRDMLRSMQAMATESGAPPKWVLGVGETGGMVGDSSAVVFADSWARGIHDFDLAAAYEVLNASATTQLQHGGRDHVSDYMSDGYMPIESGGSAGSKTLEFSLDDYALSVLADALGKSGDAETFRARASNWKNIYDTQSGFLIGRHADGSFATDEATDWPDYWAEGTTWQYTWFVPHDAAGLAEVMGGREAFLTRLDDFFATSSCQPNDHLLPQAYYWHSNEPVLGVSWMFSDLDDASRTAKWSRWALTSQYGDGPDGIPGNDDGGAMSAWWLFTASGFYPRLATSEYLIGAPSLPKVTLTLPGGDFTIVANGPSNGYPVSATLDGQKLARPRFDQSQIVAGGTLEIELAAEAGDWR